MKKIHFRVSVVACATILPMIGCNAVRIVPLANLCSKGQVALTLCSTPLSQQELGTLHLEEKVQNGCKKVLRAGAVLGLGPSHDIQNLATYGLMMALKERPGTSPNLRNFMANNPIVLLEIYKCEPHGGARGEVSETDPHYNPLVLCWCAEPHFPPIGNIHYMHSLQICISLPHYMITWSKHISHVVGERKHHEMPLCCITICLMALAGGCQLTQWTQIWIQPN